MLRAEGSWWIAFGSHWDGIFLQRLDDDLRSPVGERHHLAARPRVQHNPIEAPTIVEHDGWFYPFTSWDRCCAGDDQVPDPVRRVGGWMAARGTGGPGPDVTGQDGNDIENGVK